MSHQQSKKGLEKETPILNVEKPSYNIRSVRNDGGEIQYESMRTTNHSISSELFFDNEQMRLDSPSKHLNALLGMSNLSAPKYHKKHERTKENRSPNLTSESFDEVSSHIDQLPGSTAFQPSYEHNISHKWIDVLPSSPQRDASQLNGLITAQSPDINISGMAGSLDFLLFTDEKAPVSQYRNAQQHSESTGWLHDRLLAETVNLSSAFSAVDAPKKHAPRSRDFDILDTASEYSDIRPQKNDGLFHSFGSLRESGELWRSSGGESSNLGRGSEQGDRGTAFTGDSLRQSAQGQHLQGPGSLRNSWEAAPGGDGGVAQLGRDLAGASLRVKPDGNSGSQLRNSRDFQHQYLQQQQQQQQQHFQHDSQYQQHPSNQQQQQHYYNQRGPPPPHARINSGSNARSHHSIVDSAGGSTPSGGGGVFRPNADFDFEPQIGGGRQQLGRGGPVGNSTEFRSSGRSIQSSLQQGGFPRYSALQSSIDSDGGHSLSSSRNQFHSLDANSSHFYPSCHHHSQSGNTRSSRDLGRSVSSGLAAGSGAMGTVSLTGSTRQELVESPRGKAAYKEFYRNFRIKEKESVQAARIYAAEALGVVGESVKWRVYLEMADLCRRHHLTQDARQCFALVCQSQPRAAAGFLEWSKLEEDSGRMRDALNVLFLGLKVSPAHELLLARAIRLQERLHNYNEVRRTLGVSLAGETLDRAWKSVLEGALFEARVGNMPVAKQLLRFLMTQVPWYGPIYFEAFRLEEKENSDGAALRIIHRGLEELPRYGPLWFGLLRIMERQDTAEELNAWTCGERPQLGNMCREADEAIRLISRELTWKVHFEKAQAQERAAEVAARGLHRTSNQSLKACRDHLLFDARNSLVRSLLSCPENLRWKILLAGSRLELGVGAVDTARTLLRRAFAEVPVKSRANVFLECSRLEEFVGNLDVARLVLARARSEVRSEWKVFLETVLLEARSGHIAAAVVAAREAVDVHPGTGRLWAMYIQLLNRVDEAGDAGALGTQRESSHQVVVRAITEVPKSGEVWCERARCLLNPLCVRSFDLSEAQRALSFAAQFTPQYGDTFIEYARLEMLCQVLLPQVLGLLRMPVQTFLQSRLSEDLDADLVDLLLVESEEGREDYWEDLQRVVGPVMDVPARNFDRPNRRQQMQDVLRLDHDFRNSPQDYATVALGSLHRRCMNADPNYGSAWFECRDQPYDVPSSILDVAIKRLAADVHRAERLYARAILHFVCRSVNGEGETSGSDATESAVSDERQAQLRLRAEARAAQDPSAGEEEILRLADLRSDVTLVQTLLGGDGWTMPARGEPFAAGDFVTGLLDMNRDAFRCDLPEETRRKCLFGSDQIIS